MTHIYKLEDPDAGKNWRHKKKGKTGWDGRMASLINRHEFEQTQGDSDGQRSLACCFSWGHKDLDTTSNWTATLVGMAFVPLTNHC